MTRADIIQAVRKNSPFVYTLHGKSFFYKNDDDSKRTLLFILNVYIAKENMVKYCQIVDESLVDQTYSLGDGNVYNASEVLSKLFEFNSSDGLLNPITIIVNRNDGQNEIDGGAYEEDHLVPIDLTTTSFEVADEIPVEAPKKKKKKKKSIN